MKNKKVVQVRCHVAVQIGATVKETVSCKVNKVQMEMNVLGVHMYGAGVDSLIPWANIQRVDLADADPAGATTGEPVRERQKPGPEPLAS